MDGAAAGRPAARRRAGDPATAGRARVLSRRRAGLLLVTVAIALGLYALKKSAGVNLFEEISLSAYPPFRQLGADTLIVPRAGETMLADSFDTRFAWRRQWPEEVMSGRGRFPIAYGTGGVAGSRCAIVRSAEPTWWNLPHRYLVAVQPGNGLHAEAMVMKAHPAGRAEIHIAAYDAARRPLGSARWRSATQRHGAFERLELDVTIPPGVAFVRLRLAGRGAGEFRFDDVVFARRR